MSSELREALSEIIDLIDKWRNEGEMEHWQYSQLFDIADNALSAPPRNCDVGTTEEQYARIWEFCRRHKDGLRCVDCHINGVFPKNCALIWANMPYDKGDEDEFK